MLPLSNGCNATSLIFDSVGAITNRLRNIARPITTWFGGIAVSPSALRVSESTITMRVKLVSITISAGAIASTVSNRMMMMLWFGLPFGFLLSPLPVRLPRSMEIEPVLPVEPLAPLAPRGARRRRHRSRQYCSCRESSVLSSSGRDRRRGGGGGAVIVGAVIGVIDGGVGAAPAGPVPPASARDHADEREREHGADDEPTARGATTSRPDGSRRRSAAACMRARILELSHGRPTAR